MSHSMSNSLNVTHSMFAPALCCQPWQSLQTGPTFLPPPKSCQPGHLLLPQLLLAVFALGMRLLTALGTLLQEGLLAMVWSPRPAA
jgi:hypothetical protein